MQQQLVLLNPVHVKLGCIADLTVKQTEFGTKPLDSAIVSSVPGQ